MLRSSRSIRLPLLLTFALTTMTSRAAITLTSDSGTEGFVATGNPGTAGLDSQTHYRLEVP